LPDVPTFAELGFKGMATPWLGIFAPAGTPAPIVQRLNAEFLKALKDPQVRERLEQLAFEPVGSSPEEFAKFLDEELASNGKLIRELGIKPD
jgi:tripartite-type tricarboxylate transporter receptor subunit TctC